MKKKTKIWLSIIGAAAACIFGLMLLSELGAVEIGIPRLWFDEYRGLPVSQTFIQNMEWGAEVDGVEYRDISRDTEWEAWQTDEKIGYGSTFFSLMNWMTLENDPQRDFLVYQRERGSDTRRELYGRTDMPVPQVDIETVDRIRFYIGEGDSDAQKEDLQQGSVTEDKELISRFLDAKDAEVSTFTGKRRFVGLLSLESDQYPMLTRVYGIYRNKKGIYAVSEYDGYMWNEEFDRPGVVGGVFWSTSNFLDIPQDVMLALMGQAE
ncbi:MAG: hypothetical protein VB082_02965 [Christensenella sp.]|nr:hypothetical protein [Christensenella sp.]